MKYRFSRAGCLFFMLTCLVACSGEGKQEVEKYIKAIKHKTSKSIKPIPPLLPVASFQYPVKDTRFSPFKPRILQANSDTTSAWPSQAKGALPVYTMEAVQWVGTLQVGERLWAFIKQPDNSLLRVSVGDYLGSNHAKVRAINPDYLQLEEITYRAGQKVTRIIRLHLSKVEGVKGSAKNSHSSDRINFRVVH